ncbi:MAG: hypothetical protein OXF74_07140 [Rhodobacteraceae bacterium]|nr:hypothetical protein [Paracoccaceae bacterium]
MTFIRVFVSAAVFAVAVCEAAAGDSTGIAEDFSIAKKSDSSLLGTATDGKLCLYRQSDGKLHCHSANSPGGTAGFIAVKTARPKFAGFGRNTEGRLTVTAGTRYAFHNAETSTPLADGRTAIHCKLALQLRLINGDTLWVWHDEVRFGTAEVIAYIDSDGDGHADLAVRGQWSGRVNGSRRWSTSDVNDTSISAAEKRFTARPDLGNSGSRSRACRPAAVIVAELTDAAAKTRSSLTGSIRTVLDVKGN